MIKKKDFLVCLQLIIISVLFSKTTAHGQSKIIYFPLDERFATRGMFLNMAKIISVDYQVLTPPTEIICNYRQSASLPKLQ